MSVRGFGLSRTYIPLLELVSNQNGDKILFGSHIQNWQDVYILYPKQSNFRAIDDNDSTNIQLNIQ